MGLTQGLEGIRNIQSKKKTIQCLHDHLAFYLQRVRSLEDNNWRLENNIREHLEKK